MTPLQFITHQNENHSYLEGAELALQGGCRWIQLRMKPASADEWLTVGRKLRQLCHRHGATFIIDDRVELVETLGADGVHLGQEDMPIPRARQLLGADKIIGGTANTLEQIRVLHRQGVDYIGCGPYRYTATKERLAPTIGLLGYERLMIYMAEEEITTPLYAIGGILRADVRELMQSGIDGIAVSGAILNADNPVTETQLIINEIAKHGEEI
ncbi:MAG: thiamine phosphate synthase [Porphyromonas sp.]|nr:thiamine phosphate synthase [Porphyromonas sp.]